MIVNSNLAKGAQKLAKEKVIVKKLSAIQNLGAMLIIAIAYPLLSFISLFYYYTIIILKKML